MRRLRTATHHCLALGCRPRGVAENGGPILSGKPCKVLGVKGLEQGIALQISCTTHWQQCLVVRVERLRRLIDRHAQRGYLVKDLFARSIQVVLRVSYHPLESCNLARVASLLWDGEILASGDKVEGAARVILSQVYHNEGLPSRPCECQHVATARGATAEAGLGHDRCRRQLSPVLQNVICMVFPLHVHPLIESTASVPTCEIILRQRFPTLAWDLLLERAYPGSAAEALVRFRQGDILRGGLSVIPRCGAHVQSLFRVQAGRAP
mmetsp:Transcript_65913/g.166109  ORF Transcript_65913/g.166109 Transcript_65913/m.166109 type:complete len:266 (-) Transcript_65913:208-1005(-)